jgi:hypothetical protein
MGVGSIVSVSRSKSVSTEVDNLAFAALALTELRSIVLSAIVVTLVLPNPAKAKTDNKIAPSTTTKPANRFGNGLGLLVKFSSVNAN